ncbi:MAG: hypothetical protein GTN36_00785 [Candidatus Aenigmarchaeota archaeon]|nr:hypothetical protein [Candidatus Aenigmarchaeota archaeon]
MVKLKVNQLVETKVPQYFNEKGNRVQKLEKATIIISVGSRGTISRVDNLPIPNSAQVYFKDLDMHVAYSQDNLKPVKD